MYLCPVEWPLIHVMILSLSDYNIALHVHKAAKSHLPISNDIEANTTDHA